MAGETTVITPKDPKKMYETGIESEQGFDLLQRLFDYVCDHAHVGAWCGRAFSCENERISFTLADEAP